jgi:hypothetical protein
MRHEEGKGFPGMILILEAKMFPSGELLGRNKATNILAQHPQFLTHLLLVRA